MFLTRPVLFVPAALFAALLATFFSHTDLAHSVFSSYALFEGHIFDFYDYNATVLTGNDYLVPIYLVFAIWMAPIYLVGLSTTPFNYSFLQLNVFELYWAKLGLILLLIICAQVLRKIVAEIAPQDGMSKKLDPSWLFMFSPVALFTVVVMGQYDIIGLTLTAFGIYSWQQKKFRSFIVLFAIAITIKYIALLVFVPLLLIQSKRWTHIAGSFAAGITPLLVLFSAYSTNEAFVMNVLKVPLRLLDWGTEARALDISLRLLVLVWALAITFFLHRIFHKRTVDKFTFAVKTIVILLSIFFTVIRWNPQWLLVLIFFLVIIQSINARSKTLILLESFGFVGITWLAASLWSNKLDQIMITRGPLNSWIPDAYLTLADFYSPNLMWIGFLIAQISIILPALIAIMKPKNPSRSSSESPKAAKTIYFVKPFFFVVSFLVPVSICFSAPLTFAQKLTDKALYNSMTRSYSDQYHSNLFSLEPQDSISQSFEIQTGNLRAIGVDISGDADPSNLDLELKIVNSQGRISQTITPSAFTQDNSFQGFDGWREVIFDIANQAQNDRQSFNVQLSNNGEMPVNIWLDTVRPPIGKLIGSEGMSANASLVISKYTTD